MVVMLIYRMKRERERENLGGAFPGLERVVGAGLPASHAIHLRVERLEVPCVSAQAPKRTRERKGG